MANHHKPKVIDLGRVWMSFKAHPAFGEGILILHCKDGIECHCTFDANSAWALAQSMKRVQKLAADEPDYFGKGNPHYEPELMFDPDYVPPRKVPEPSPVKESIWQRLFGW